jgi:hypothetical protein
VNPSSTYEDADGPPNTAFSCEGPPEAIARGAAKRLRVPKVPWDLVSCNALLCGHLGGIARGRPGSVPDGSV